MKRYPEYQLFEGNWLSSIPATWKQFRGKILFHDIDKRSETGEEELLTVSHITGVTPRKEKNVTMFKAESLEGYKLCEVGDFASNTMWMWMGAIGVSKYSGLVSPSYNVYRQKNSDYLSEYLEYLLREPNLVAEYRRHSTGVRPSRLRLYPDKFLNIVFPLPSLGEQKAIADFLDKKTEQIDRFISLQKEAISLLKELRQAEITKAVTKGLDENAEMKDSGVEWIGEIPKEWGVSYLKELFSFGRGLPITKDDLKENGIPVISYGQIHSKENIGTKITSNLVRYVDESYLSTNSKSLVKIGDFIFADTSEDLDGCGNAVYVNTNMMLFAGYHTLILKSKVVRDNKYLAYLFKSNLWRIQIRKSVYGVKLYSVTQRIMKEVTILHPSLCEQQDIVSYLDQKCAEIDSAIQNKEALIEKVTEYKTRLISDAVTGKIDVRGEAI